MDLRLFWEIAQRSYQRYLTYRAATLAGLVTNFFFGILRASILVALFGAQTEVEGISLQGAVTYAAMTQAVIGYLSLFNWFDLMRTVYTGEIGSDLLKPMSFISYWMARDLGRAVVQFVFRGLIVMAGYALIFDLVWPQEAIQWLDTLGTYESLAKSTEDFLLDKLTVVPNLNKKAIYMLKFFCYLKLSDREKAGSFLERFLSIKTKHDFTDVNNYLKSLL